MCLYTRRLNEHNLEVSSCVIPFYRDLAERQRRSMGRHDPDALYQATEGSAQEWHGTGTCLIRRKSMTRTLKGHWNPRFRAACC